jgi:polygalacturonase
VGKVLLTYTHSADETKLIVETSYDQDVANGTKPFTIVRNSYKFEIQHKQSVALKQMYVSGDHSNPKGLYIAAKHPYISNEGVAVQNTDVTLKPIGRVTAVQIEPGIVLLTDGGALMYVPKGGRDPRDLAAEKLQPIVCLYTKDKEAKALKLTQEEMFTMLQLREKKGNDRSDAGEDGHKEMDEEIRAAAAANTGSGSENVDAKSDAKSTTKEDKIKIEFHNKTGSTDVYLVFDNNKGYQGTGRIGKGQITSYYFKAGAVVKYKNGGALMTVSAGDNQKRVMVSQ